MVLKIQNIFYIDYECNKYDPKWDYDNWGKQYWEKKQSLNIKDYYCFN